MRQLTKNTGFFLLFLSLLSSCGEYHKVLKGDNIEKKYEMAKNFFNEEEYQKAVLLLEDILPFFRASAKNEKIKYMYAYCQYAMGSNIIAANRFKNLYDTYPYGKYAQESLYYFAYCTYLESPPVELDQKSSERAIEAIQLFINKFPNSDKVEKSNEYIDKLLLKIEEKAVHKAKLYYKIQDYKATIWSLQNLFEEFPMIEDRSYLNFIMIDSYYELAINSVVTKQHARLEDTRVFYEENTKEFEDSEYAIEAKNIYKNTLNQLDKLKLKNERKN